MVYLSFFTWHTKLWYFSNQFDFIIIQYTVCPLLTQSLFPIEAQNYTPPCQNPYSKLLHPRLNSTSPVIACRQIDDNLSSNSPSLLQPIFPWSTNSQRHPILPSCLHWDFPQLPRVQTFQQCRYSAPPTPMEPLLTE